MAKKKVVDVSRIPVISFSGKKGYGKDYWSDNLVKRYKNIRKIAYADGTRLEVDKIMEMYEDGKSFEEISILLKAKPEEISDLIDIYNTSHLRYPELKSSSRTAVTLKMLQFWGTSVRRARYSKNYWVDKLMEIVKSGNEEGYSYVISDARFPNEVEAVHKLKGIAFSLKVSEEEQIRRLKERDGFIPDVTQLSHISETGLDGYNKFSLELFTELYSNELIEGIIDDLMDSWNTKK